jgi:hypothetical protein
MTYRKFTLLLKQLKEMERRYELLRLLQEDDKGDAHSATQLHAQLRVDFPDVPLHVRPVIGLRYLAPSTSSSTAHTSTSSRTLRLTRSVCALCAPRRRGREAFYPLVARGQKTTTIRYHPGHIHCPAAPVLPLQLNPSQGALRTAV